MVEASCHCGAVRIEIAQPQTLTDCNCSICRRYGGLWAYYPPKEVRFVERGPTDTYAWGDFSIDFHRCAGCGCITHWQARDPSIDRMGINARLMDLDVVGRARIRRLDGAVTEQYLDD